MWLSPLGAPNCIPKNSVSEKNYKNGRKREEKSSRPIPPKRVKFFCSSIDWIIRKEIFEFPLIFRPRRNRLNSWFHFQWRNQSITIAAEWWFVLGKFQAHNRSDDEYKWKVKCAAFFSCLHHSVATLNYFLMIFHFFTPPRAVVLVMIHKKRKKNI